MACVTHNWWTRRCLSNLVLFEKNFLCWKEPVFRKSFHSMESSARYDWKLKYLIDFQQHVYFQPERDCLTSEIYNYNICKSQRITLFKKSIKPVFNEYFYMEVSGLFKNFFHFSGFLIWQKHSYRTPFTFSRKIFAVSLKMGYKDRISIEKILEIKPSMHSKIITHPA